MPAADAFIPQTFALECPPRSRRWLRRCAAGLWPRASTQEVAAHRNRTSSRSHIAAFRDYGSIFETSYQTEAGATA